MSWWKWLQTPSRPPSPACYGSGVPISAVIGMGELLVFAKDEDSGPITSMRKVISVLDRGPIRVLTTLLIESSNTVRSLKACLVESDKAYRAALASGLYLTDPTETIRGEYSFAELTAVNGESVDPSPPSQDAESKAPPVFARVGEPPDIRSENSLTGLTAVNSDSVGSTTTHSGHRDQSSASFRRPR